MKNTFIFLIAVVMMITNSFAQTITAKKEALKNQIIASEKSGWNAWKNKDVEWFKINTTESFINVSRDGIINKTQVVTSTATECDIKSVSIDDFTFVMLNEKTAVLSYIANQDGVCGNSKLPAKIRVSATYVKQGDKWLKAFYMEAVIEELKSILDIELSIEANQH